MAKVYKTTCAHCGRIHSSPFKHTETDFYCNVECMKKSLDNSDKILEGIKRIRKSVGKLGTK